MTPADFAILEADSWFGRIPSERQALLLADAQPRSVAAGARFYDIGDPPNGLWAVLEGQVGVRAYPSAGLVLLAPVLSPGTWFGETSTLDGLPRPTDAIAFEPARVLHLSMAGFARAAAEAPELYHDLGVLACLHHRAALTFIGQIVSQPVRVRLARLLAGSARGSGMLKLRQEDLAVLVGVSRQTLNRHLRALEREKVIDLAYAEITIRDPARLHAVATHESR